MAVGITATYNNSFHSPGFDLAVTGLTGYSNLTIKRVFVPGYPDSPVRGADSLSINTDSFAVSDFEAPVNLLIAYEARASTRVVSDTFTRTGGGGLGTASSGFPWASPTPAQFSTNGTGGVVVMEVVTTPRISTLQPPFTSSLPTDAEGAIKFKLPVAPAGSGIGLGVIGRYLDSQNYYLGELAFEPGGAINARIRKVVAGVTSNLATDVSTGMTLNTPSFYWVKLQIIGTTLRLRAWADGTTEPSTWLITATDSSLASGTWGVRGQVVAGGTNTLPVTAQFDSLTVSSIGVSPFFEERASPGTTVSIPSPGIGTAWLKSVFQPALSSRVNIVDFDEVSRPARVLGEYEVLGKRNKVVITDCLGGREGTITLATYKEGSSASSSIIALMEEGGTLLLQSTGEEETGEKDLYLEVTDFSRKRIGIISEGEMVHLHTIGFIEVDRAGTFEESLGLRSWNDILSVNFSWDVVNSAYTNWLDVLQRDDF